MTSPLAAVLALLAGFALFMTLIAGVHALNRHARRRFGYEPLSLPNAALMCIPSLLLLSAGQSAGDAGPAAAWASEDTALAARLGLAAAIAGAMFALLAWRTSARVAALATPILTLAAPVVLMSLLFRRLAGGEAERGQTGP